ncbi:hypothetical protein HPB51_002692 [Rhipicephalus microplus]|uniref:Transposable element P transposase-like RNase H domain-containing protein n=1 Tax=Rhipicephalus microplus TaxID=6941 RepID=A0A9J6EQI9_RHIMP|nr:hypothetical protein HPB51_002692 [Rhipicephalus microplus]
MLPLPSLSRLAQILKGLPCKYGFNPVCLEAIQKQFHGKADEQRLGSLILDEIKLRQAYDFNKCSYKMDGFVDYGGVTNEGTNQLADHALVLMFVPLFESWVQPIAAFATNSPLKQSWIRSFWGWFVPRTFAVTNGIMGTKKLEHMRWWCTI